MRTPALSLIPTPLGHTTRQEALKMTLRMQDRWLPVVGQRVEIRRHGAIVRRGTVDSVTADDGTLWVAAEGLEQRRMFHRSDGFEVWVKLPIRILDA